MTRYVIIEDERFAYEELKRMMRNLRPDYELTGWAQTTEQATLLIRQNAAELIIADIRLADGLCFDVFEQCHTDTPVIFTTAYDEYAIKAFRLNSIDYLLKPVDEDELSRAISKFERNALVRPSSAAYGQMAHTYMQSMKKNRFLVQIGDNFRYVETADIAAFYSEDKATFLHTFTGKRYIINHSLEQIEAMIDGQMFFRASRSCIANIKAVKRVSRFFGGKLHVTLEPDCGQKVSVSRARATDFLNWMDGGGC